MCAYPFHAMEEENRRSSPFLALIVVVVIGGGTFWFLQNYQVAGLDQVSIQSKSGADGDLPESVDDSLFGTPTSLPVSASATPAAFVGKPSTAGGAKGPVRPIRIGSWSLSGFGPTKMANDLSRINLVRIVRHFDVMALQQITAAERDVIPRLVDEINEGGRRFDFAIGRPTGPDKRPEMLAIIFDTTRVQIDRTQTYSVADPQNQMTYDPMVAWFRAAEPDPSTAWTFSILNVRIDLGRAPIEVALLPAIFSSVRLDGRGEDDVVMTGLFQADDSYLMPKVMGQSIDAAVRSTTTDIFNRHQTSNILVDRHRTSEWIGRGGAVDFLRRYNLTLTEAESVSSHLPIFAEFTATEGGQL